MANSVNPDRMLWNGVSDLGLHCLLRPVCPILRVVMVLCNVFAKNRGTDKNGQVVFSKNISIYAIFNDQNFNDTLTSDIVSFEQLGPGLLLLACAVKQASHDRLS